LKRETVFIALGSNLGNREKNITQALGLLQATPGIRLKKTSAVIETDPIAGPPQEKYLNAVIQVQTSLKPKELLKILQAIEIQLGRVRTVKNAPRTIDLDILLFGDLTLNDPDLIVPHPRMFERYFVLKPLLEIAPDIFEVSLLAKPFKQKALEILKSSC
jgi:2-amino-4-hydroxy-6-hydroxymethyldihydropteridine diphosphokinase